MEVLRLGFNFLNGTLPIQGKQNPSSLIPRVFTIAFGMSPSPHTTCLYLSFGRVNDFWKTKGIRFEVESV